MGAEAAAIAAISMMASGAHSYQSAKQQQKAARRQADAVKKANKQRATVLQRQAKKEKSRAKADHRRAEAQQRVGVASVGLAPSSGSILENAASLDRLLDQNIEQIDYDYDRRKQNLMLDPTPYAERARRAGAKADSTLLGVGTNLLTQGAKAYGASRR